MNRKILINRRIDILDFVKSFQNFDHNYIKYLEFELTKKLIEIMPSFSSFPNEDKNVKQIKHQLNYNR